MLGCRIPLLVLALALGACAGAPEPVAPVPGGGTLTEAATATAAATITPEDFRQRIGFLASDELLGRDTPSPGLETAGRWLADQFREFGLRPAGDEGGYMHMWSYDVPVVDAVFELRRGSQTAPATWKREFFIIPGAGPVTGDAVWAGSATQGGMAGGAGMAGNVAFVYLPGEDLDAAFQQALQAGMMGAMAAGAAGLVFVMDARMEAGLVGQIAASIGPGQIAPIPVVGMSYATAERLLAEVGQDLDVLRNRTGGEAQALEGVRVQTGATVTSSPAEVANVAAVLPGSDPELRDTYVVLTAHYDHTGVGAPDASGDSIFNGADDDASGTAMLVEVAQALATLPEAPRRSVLFLAVSGEEKGLLGSEAYVDDPTVPLERIVANINLDMVGRNHPDSVTAIGLDFSSLGPLAMRIAADNPELGLVIAPDMQPEENLFARSDHFNFAKHEIPAIFFTTGLHDQYHLQGDEAELIAWDKITRIGRLVFHLTHAVAQDPTPPAWTDEGLEFVRDATRPPGND
ncbi:MAG: M28 family peptidase [Gemmatimonadota bacterium]